MDYVNRINYGVHDHDFSTLWVERKKKANETVQVSLKTLYLASRCSAFNVQDLSYYHKRLNSKGEDISSLFTDCEDEEYK